MHYRSVGDVPRKRHLRVPHPSGDGFLFEELMGSDGFSQESALLYHLRSPSALVDIAAVDDPRALQPAPTADCPLQPRHLRTADVPPRGDAVLGRTVLLANDDVVISCARPSDPSPLYRNAGGDELIYAQRGALTLETVFGSLDVTAGDYAVVPTSTTHRWLPRTDDVEMLIVECRHGHLTVPSRYLSARGQLVEGAPYSERDFHGPAAPLFVDGDDPGVIVRNAAGLTRLTHAGHPFDVIAWDGCLYPFTFSILDFEPLVGAIHQPPPVHQTFAGPGFVVCSFVPRPFDFHPEAIKIPYHHANVDSDEVLFYSGGDFMSRTGSGIGPGSISFHPAGFVHGPQPGSMERSAGQTATGETAVMIDTFRPLMVSDAARAISDDAYAFTWSGGRRK
jgi:homogentisate 1,2-dioxygenase